ncbi:alpha-ribazole phosphatase [Halanaerobium congolense]|jgi:alpha-ribazole phosphatase|uniref:Alpha-ribazole phosphatase n=1 Tax=Halanaerobium congolense TaxID=54121 RepID=A0A1G7PMF3_9FIRM|nr:alpha-ribazole phosphatase [Halanaerobium congolense]PTX15394.1 alpha-ribazole phosphatase/probable phosphoglycerate mutase [Halanaerobium congolense]PXV64826.1 alpha-ribazole phosphatase/probable phosphoglycerate mutase [Halanaerobium congolense]TDP14335.1 alpha-ribazole phosphatase/probable phosphoglycerate mutase [Halanaerobium congolense]TDS35402.1 alpha-ribazole phosphatase/probable phosphoglycerate mutase [Halanaerobium congolense]SDF86839.1 Histidine phosphatase superfamily (branch 1
MLTKLYLLRHGETDWNQKSIFQGQTDIDLNKNGKNDAQKAAEILQDIKLDQIYSSDLKRAKNTALMISQAKNLKIKENKQLREICFGDWEGLSFSEIKKQYPKQLASWQQDPLNYSPPAGEKLLDFKKRIVNFFTKMINKNKGDKILVVAHGGVIKVYLTAILSIDPQNFWQFQIDNGSLTELKFYDEDIILSKLNFTNTLN